MKLALIGDFIATPWRYGRRVTVGNWAFQDSAHTPNPTPEDERLSALSPLNGTARGEIRSVWHHGTLMGSFRLTKQGEWEFTPISRGWGSVSDQQGMNKILKGFGWVYRRNGGNARYERI